MIISTLIKPSAQVAVVTELAAGDIYKRLDTSGYAGHRLVLGLVTDVMQNGEKAAVSAIEFTPPEYTSAPVEPKLVTFAGDQDVALYPVQRAEFDELVKALEVAQANTVETAERDLARKQGVLAQVRALANNGITEATTRMLTS